MLQTVLLAVCIKQMLSFLDCLQDGTALCYCHHQAWRSHTKAKDENGGPTSSVSVSFC